MSSSLRSRRGWSRRSSESTRGNSRIRAAAAVRATRGSNPISRRRFGTSTRQTAVVVPIGFLCDHVEVLYDLDIEAAQVAREAGIRMERAPTVGDHPLFIEMMASIVAAHVR